MTPIPPAISRSVGFRFWLLSRLAPVSFRQWNLPSALTILGIVIGVASLSLSMAVVHGFERALRASIIDLYGDVMLIRQSPDHPAFPEVSRELKEKFPDILAVTPFYRAEGLIAGGGQTSGIVIHGIDPATAGEVLALDRRLLRGRGIEALKESSKDRESKAPASALVGRLLAERYHLEIGSEFRLVVPVTASNQSARFTTRIARFVTAGIVDLGKSDYDSRTVILSNDAAKEISGSTDPYIGLRLKLRNDEQAPMIAAEIAASEWGKGWRVADWKQVNPTFLHAIQFESKVIFMVIGILVILASFNVAAIVFVNVVSRTSEIAILRTMGWNRRSISGLFRSFGVILGAVGTGFGLIVGWIAAQGFGWMQSTYGILPGDVYKIYGFRAEIDPMHLLVILFFTFAICWTASVAPALRAARMKPVEGIRHD